MDCATLSAFVLHRQQRRAVVGFALLVMLNSAGCDNGTVVANGHVMIEGQPAFGGRLSLTPIGGGPRAFSPVDEFGAFALRVSGDSLGVFPGSYHVFFQQELDAQDRARLAREMAGQVAVEELTCCYRGPRGNPLVIPESGDQNLVIDIRRNLGWTRHLND